MNTNPTAYVLGPEEGEAFWGFGALWTPKATAEQTGGRFSMIEEIAPRGEGTPLHVHREDDETFYVLEGEVLFHVDGDEHAASPGDTVSVPRGVPHAFVVTSDVAKFLVLNTPGTHDKYFRDGGEPATHQDFEAAPAPDYERMEASNRKHGVEVLGPPPFAAVEVTA